MTVTGLPENITEIIVNKAFAMGFSACGISEANFLSEDAAFMEEWLSLGYQGDMTYLERNKEKRYNPKLLVDHAWSVVSVLYNYFPEEKLPVEDNYKISKYAYGTDYHIVIKDKLNELFQFTKAYWPDLTGRVFTDSAPVLDRAWAEKSGLGFIGKNTCLIHPRKGSFHFVGHLILSIPLAANNKPVTDYCGTCRRCIDACPTGALVAPHKLDARKCISYLTIENKQPFSQDYHFDDWIFGCDICQDVCPWNRFSEPHSEPLFRLTDEIKALKKTDWESLTEESFNMIFKDSAVKRTKFSGLKRNIEAAGKK
ncbi:MAG: tRNA epoxyqueuosine(34) reductase QueG [Bacteroidales bacterium]|nr:tRNA epoxyqueuosine(34) reductase QueG [Bacteroidales bacterium]